MKIHTMNLSSQPFAAIKDGTKVIESRLYDAKRRKIELGDEIIFHNDDSADTLKTKVVGLLRYPTFREMFEDNDPLKFGGPDADWLTNQIEEFYSPEKQLVEGVIGVRIQRV